MRCRLFRSKVVAYADGELPPDEAQTMQAHARSCPECAAELAAVERETDLYTAALRSHEAPVDLTDGVMSALEGVHLLPQAPPAQPTRGIPVKWVLSVSAAAAVVLFVALGSMSVSLSRAYSHVSRTPAWRIIAANEAVQVGGFRASPSGGPIYTDAGTEVTRASRRATANPVRLVSFDGQAIHQPAPAFEVEEYTEAAKSTAEGVKSLNAQLGRPQAVTAAEQGALNAELYRSAAPGGAGPGAAVEADFGMERRTGQPRAMYGPPAATRAPSAVVVDSTDARVVLTVSYEKDEDRYVTTYDADFTADYVIRAPQGTGKGARIVVTFPFPAGCSTVSGSKLLVDEQPDEDHTTYSIAGMRWENWFKPGESKTISIAYRARGQGNYRYVLDKVNLTRRLRLLMRVDGIEAGRAIEIPSDALPPGSPPRDVPGRWDYAWDYTRLLTTRDIAVDFPTKESPSAAAGRVMQTVGEYLFVARLAPIFLVVFLGALALGGLWNRAQALRVEELGLLGIAFLLFYPLFLFGAAYLGRDAALLAGVAIVVLLSAAYVARVNGAALAARVGLLEAVLLGAFTYALFDKAVTGLIFTIGAAVLLAYFMLLHGRRAAERAAGDPAAVARAEVTHEPDRAGDETSDA